LIVLLLVNRVSPGIGILLLPVWLVLLILLALGVGLCASALTVSYRDVQYILPVATQFLMYASPVAYSVTRVPASLHSLYFLNPLSGLLEAFRWSVIGEGTVHWGYVGYSAVFTLVVF